ncbi:hypothetical protein [Sphingobacterium paucimobilis]|nr:hypothetical protein [Sphingobacterium paucimobilis]
MIKIFTYVFFLFLSVSCAKEKKVIAKFDFQENRTFTEFLEKDNADRSNYIVTILGISKCDLCGFVKEKMASFSGLPPNVLFRSVDLTKSENKWLEQLLREFSYPLILITNPQNELVGFVKGARLNVLKEAFQNTFNKRIFFDDGKGLFLNQYEAKEVSSAVKIDFLNTQIQSYLDYEKKESLDPDELDRLRKSVNAYPYFFNTYLLYQFTKEKELLDQLFRTYNANVDQFLYTGLKKNLISTEELQFIDSWGRSWSWINIPYNLAKGSHPIKRRWLSR